jgi:hypothetical protein
MLCAAVSRIYRAPVREASIPGRWAEMEEMARIPMWTSWWSPPLAPGTASSHSRRKGRSAGQQEVLVMAGHIVTAGKRYGAS